MIIRDHCQPGHWRNLDNWIPKQEWPEDCMVQWGSGGLVLVQEGDNYRTAFFEAFPRNPDTFIRGEGKTIEEAEAAAFRRFQKQVSCQNHEFERRKYRNGYGICKNCGLGMTVFEPMEKCCQCGVACYYSCDKNGNWWCEKCAPTMPEEVMTEMQKEMRCLEPDMDQITEEDIKTTLETMASRLKETP